jgi:CDP-diacylglycerol--glycerol-3-phosphate 3-phosphatidyltransferase
MKKFVLSLTLFRIFSGPMIFILSLIFDAYLLALLIFLAASFSDYLDGKFARSFNVESSLGATLDPIADKILVLFSLIAISLITQDPFVAIMSALILSREFWVSALREFSAQNSISEATKVTFLAKAKTTIQFLAISIFLIGFEFNNALMIFLASFILFLALLITLKTAIEYSRKVFNF